MSGRRNGNRIRGPQSALTDFLSANNISAAQIRDDYERRRREAEQDPNAGEGPSAQTDNDEALAAAAQAEEEQAIETGKKRKRKAEAAVEKVKKAKASKKDSKGKQSAKKKKGRKSSSDDDEEDVDNDYEDDLGKDMYKKSRPAPGQFEHCEVCSKRFTVTPYSKEGPDGGLLCTPCGKELAKGLKNEKKAPAPKPQGKKRRKMESDKLDGVALGGSKSLQQMCIEKVAKHHEDIDELGDMPQPVLERLSEIFSKKRVLKPKTLPLFLRPDLDSVVVHDAAYLEPSDYQRIFAEVSDMQRLVLGNACQLKDEAITYMLERCDRLRKVQLYAANLVSTEMWHRFFQEAGHRLEVVQLKWLDAAFEDESVQKMVEHAPKLLRLKLKLCRRIGEDSVMSIAGLQHLQHLSLQINHEVSSEALVHLIKERGSGLRTLSLEKFLDADDTVLQSIHDNCDHLSKLRFSENDTATDAAYTSLFTEWNNPPLTFVDFNSTRDVDNNNPDGPSEEEGGPIGFASEGFKALMAHSGSHINHLDIASCRHIQLSAFLDVFNETQIYPDLEYINISFCPRVNTPVVMGIFKSCPRLKQLVSFGCFDVSSIIVPRNIALIGVPRAQDAIEQFGVGIGVEEAVGRMVEVGA